MNPLRGTNWLLFTLFCLVPLTVPAAPGWLSPTAMALSRETNQLYVACRDGAQVLVVNTETWELEPGIKVPANPLALAVAPSEPLLAVASGGPESIISLVDTRTRKLVGTMKAGHTASALVFSPDGKTLYACNRFNDDVSVLDVAKRRERARIAVTREPVAADITPDGGWLYVVNHLPSGPANGNYVAAVVSVIDTSSGKVAKELKLPNGSSSVQDIRISPEGRYALVSHVLSRYQMPTTQLDRGWMNTNAKSIIDVAEQKVLTTVLLDTIDRGAANPWGIGWMENGRRAVVALAGTHEIVVVNFPAVMERFQKLANRTPTPPARTYGVAMMTAADVPNDLAFLVGSSQRIKLPASDVGPRAVAVLGHFAITANYFSDTLSVVDFKQPGQPPRTVPLGPAPSMTVARRGELLFNDARICFQGWQSCATCHPGEARVDALNWDLLNDGIGNPKNNKSLLYAHRTPPAMSTGIRDSAEVAVRSGVKHILFTVQPPEIYEALDTYLKQLEPVPSPALVNGKLSKAARRGEKIFHSSQAGCAGCHPAPLLTDLTAYDVGTTADSILMDTPSLVELWRTAPYLHDGSAATLREVLTTANKEDKHGSTAHLSPAEIDDLEAYLKSL